MKMFGITGWKNSGKTTLVVQLVKVFTERGYRVTTIKHAHHAFDIDQPGKDSYQHRQAGASEVLIVSSQRWALLHEIKLHEIKLHELDTPSQNVPQSEPTLKELLEKLSPADLVLVEGFKNEAHPKLMVVRSEINLQPLPPSAQTVVAIASNDAIDPKQYGCDGPLLNLNDVNNIADFIANYCQL